jgi:hypothetical protein
MDVIAVTLFFSLLLAALFFLLFFVSRTDGKSPEQESLLPLEEDANAAEGRGNLNHAFKSRVCPHPTLK